MELLMQDLPVPHRLVVEAGAAGLPGQLLASGFAAGCPHLQLGGLQFQQHSASGDCGAVDVGKGDHLGLLRAVNWPLFPRLQ